MGFNKRRSRTRKLFLEKNISFYILLTDQISLPDCLYVVRYWAIVCEPVCYDVMNFEINLIFLMNLFFLKTKKALNPNLGRLLRGPFCGGVG